MERERNTKGQPVLFNTGQLTTPGMCYAYSTSLTLSILNYVLCWSWLYFPQIVTCSFSQHETASHQLLVRKHDLKLLFLQSPDVWNSCGDNSDALLCHLTTSLHLAFAQSSMTCQYFHWGEVPGPLDKIQVILNSYINVVNEIFPSTISYPPDFQCAVLLPLGWNACIRCLFAPPRLLSSRAICRKYAVPPQLLVASYTDPEKSQFQDAYESSGTK